MRRASLEYQKIKKITKTHPIFFKFFSLTRLYTKSLHPHRQRSKSKKNFICTQHFNNIGLLFSILNKNTLSNPINFHK